MIKRVFYTPERFAQEQVHRVESPRGQLLIASCRSGTYLAGRVVRRYAQSLIDGGDNGDVVYLEDVDYHFSDQETGVRLQRDVSGYDVFLFQALYDPASSRNVDQNYVAFLIAARAFREWGANHVTAILPYLAYSRQDKPTKFSRETTTAKFMADATLAAGVDRLVTWNPHSESIRGFYDNVPVNKLEALTLFVSVFGRFHGRDDVIAVAPDAGASRLITHFGRALDLNSAIASKYRPRPEQATIAEIIGDFTGKRIAIVLDDMISSGGTVYALVQKLVVEKGIEEVYLGVSHYLGMDIAQKRPLELHRDYHLMEMIVTNSIPQRQTFKEVPFVSVYDLSDTFSRVINRIHYNRPVSDLFYDEAGNEE